MKVIVDDLLFEVVERTMPNPNCIKIYFASHDVEGRDYWELKGEVDSATRTWLYGALATLLRREESRATKQGE